MYRINKSKNNITKLEKRQFKDLGFKERENLQEWIAKNPDVLGEELLIIQKEYQGFNDTKERLDLLALDKEGNLVIIENKLDDSGKDVVWQALKYTAYSSTLTTEQIIRIYQEYLDSYSNGDDSMELLLDFLEREDNDDLLLNSNDQRIIFIANDFRKEVTSTVLWLLNHDIQVQCFRATPFSLEEETFLQIEQIIPLPETTEYMIDAKEKEKEKKGKSKKVKETNAQLIQFWSTLKERLAEKNINYLDKVSPKSKFNIGFWNGSGFFAFCIGRKAFRVELYFNSDLDKRKIDAMYAQKEYIESKLGGVQWERVDNRKLSRIKLETSQNELDSFRGKWGDESNWEDIVNWYCVKMQLFYEVMSPIWDKVQKELK